MSEYITHIARYIIPLFSSPGNFVEIGCWDGENISQTKELEDIGWGGVCVDPFPKNFHRRNCRLVAKAVSRDGNPRKYIRVTKDRRNGGDVSYFSGFDDSVKVHWPLISEHCDYEITEVATTTFNNLLLPLHINFLSVDTEGSELEIFESIPFDMYTFDVIMFEHNGVENGVANLLESKGYRLHKRLEIDDIFINSNYEPPKVAG